MRIESTDFTQYVRMLGESVLSFVLNLPIDQLKSLLNEGGEIDPSRRRALADLNHEIQEVWRRRAINPILDNSDLMQIAYLQSRDGAPLFDELRRSIDGVDLPEPSGDRVLDALIAIAHILYPIFILARNVRSELLIPPASFIYLPWRSDAELRFAEAIHRDDNLKRLFPDNSNDIFALSEMLYASHGRGGDFQYGSLARNLVSSAYSLMRSGLPPVPKTPS